MSDDEHCTGGGHRHHISCREISEFLLAYLEQELDERERVEFERHLQRCPPCIHYLDGYRETVALVRTCGRAELDPEQRQRHKPPEDLIQAILSARSSVRPSDED